VVALRKIILIALACYLLTFSVASAEVKQEFDKFTGTYTVSSTQKMFADGKTEVQGTLSKMFIPKVPYPSYDLTFIVTSDKYYFFSKNCHYLIDGQPTGKSLMVKFRDY
jgi:hypothetical protein